MVNRGRNLGEWFKDNLYNLVLLALIAAMNLAVIFYRVDQVEEKVNVLDQKVICIEDDVQDLEKDVIKQNATIIKTLKNIDYKLTRFQDKFDKYDDSIKQFYKDYDLNRRNGNSP